MRSGRRPGPPSGGLSIAALVLASITPCAVVTTPAWAQPLEIDPQTHLRAVTGEELATACALDLRPLTTLAPASQIDFGCTADGQLVEVRLPFPEADPLAAVETLFTVLGVEFDPGEWLPQDGRIDEDTGALETVLIRVQEQGLPLAGGELTVRSRDGAAYQVSGPVVPLPAGYRSVDLGPFTREDWQQELGVEVTGPRVVGAAIPWWRKLYFGAEPVAVFEASAEGSTLWLDTFGEVRHETATRPPDDFETLLYYEDGCRSVDCVSRAVDSVLALHGMTSVQNDLETRKRYGAASGRQVVIELLRKYEPWLEGVGEIAIDRLMESLRVQALFERVFEDHAVPPADREYLANVVHAIWVELNLYRSPVQPPTAPPSARHPRISWSLDEYDPRLVDGSLLGDVVEGMAHVKHRRAYQFLHYPKAASVLLRMSPYYTGLTQSQAMAIPRLVEAAADAQVHFNTYHNPRYTATPTHEQELENDLSEGYQRRSGGCGLPSFMAALLARSINLPAAVGLPPARAGGRLGLDGHRHIRFPTLKAWVHGDAIAWRPGVAADRLFRTEAALAMESTSEHQDVAAAEGHAAQSDLEYQQGVSLVHARIRHSKVRARSWFDDRWLVGFLSGTFPKATAASYAADRFGLLGVQRVGHDLRLPEFRYPLLDQAALYLPLDARYLASKRIENLTLRGADGTLNGTAHVLLQGRRGQAVRLQPGASIDLGDQPLLHRNDEELTLSLHYWPEVAYGAVFPGSLAALEDPSPGAAGPHWRLSVDNQGKITFEVRNRDGLVTLSSATALTGTGPYHLVATYAEGGEAKLYIDGVKEDEAAFTAEVDLGGYEGSDEPLDQRPASLRLGGGGFWGTLDEVLLLFGELTESEVGELAARY